MDDRNREFLETHDIISAIVPIDLDAGANAGDWVSMANAERILAVLFAAAGTAGQDPVFTLEQATSAAGGSAKALTFTKIWSKVGTLTSVGQWTKTTQAAANTYIDAVSAEAQKLIAVEVNAEDLDRANGFKFVRLSIPDVGGNAQIGCAFYITSGLRYMNPASALA